MSAPTIRVHCAGCHGTGATGGEPCPRCIATGFTDKPETMGEQFEALSIAVRNLGRNLGRALLQHWRSMLAVFLLVEVVVILLSVAR